MFKAVIFDMDGVLVDSAPFHYQSWLFIFKRFDLNYTEEDFRNSFGQTSQEILKKFFRKNNIRVSPDELNRMDEEKEKEFRRLITSKIRALPGSIKLIRSSKNKGLKTAIASSGPPENIQTIIKSLKIEDLIDEITSCKEIKLSKPSPMIFLKTAEKLLQSSSDCVVIEDAPAGVEAAKRAGMFCIAVTNTVTREKLKKADIIVNSLERVEIDKLI